MARYPNEPYDSCPSIDAAIEEMEKVREINYTLRENNREYWAKVEELETEVEILKERIAELEQEIATMEKELEH